MRQKITTLTARHIVAALFVLLSAAAAAAQDVFSLFENFIAQPAASISFIQTNTSKSGVILEQAKGKIIYQRGGKFRLQYESGDNPLIISDGKTVWLYEEAINQVITQPFASANKSGLIEVIAGGDISEIKKNYVLSAGVESNNLRLLNAYALDNSATIRHIALGFHARNGKLRQIEITDHFDSTLKIQISNIQYDIGDDTTDLFTFSPPAGSEIIESN